MIRILPSAPWRGTTAVILAVVVAAGGSAGCGETPRPSPTATIQRSPWRGNDPVSSPRPDPIALDLLVGTPGAMRLVTDVDGGPIDVLAAVAPPEASGDLRWASGDRIRGFVLTVGRLGRIFSSDPVSGHLRPTWHEVVARGSIGGRLADQPSFAVLSPNGRTIVALEGDAGSGLADARLVVMDRATGSGAQLPLGASVDGRPPAWFGDQVVAIPLRDRSEGHVAAFVDVARDTIEIVHRPADSLAVSGDGTTVASAAGEATGLVGTGSAASFRAGGTLPELEIEGGADRAAGQVMLDATGVRLAVAWLDDAGDTQSVAAYRRGPNGWRLAWEARLPDGANRAVIVGFDR